METWEQGRAMSERSATAKAEAFSIQDESHPGEPLLLTVVPTLLVVVNPESMVPTAALATRHLRRGGSKGRGKVIFGIAPKGKHDQP